jgi:hypothetical protein
MYDILNCSGGQIIPHAICNCTASHDIPIAATMLLAGLVLGMFVMEFINVWCRIHGDEEDNDS